MSRVSGVLVACVGLAGCYLSHERARDAAVDAGPTAVDAGRDASLDAGPEPGDGGGECDAGPVVLDAGGVSLTVDLLFVVDNSRSMGEEQEALAFQFRRMVRILVTGDLDEDGRAEFEPVTDLQVGVVTTELPSGEVGSCDVDPREGDDGVLRTTADFRMRGCDRRYPPFLRFRPSTPGAADRFVRDFACVATVGTEGCGYEQSLEAALKALSPAAGSVSFLSGAGHGDTENAGFVRDGAILAVVVVTDEDDCSVGDAELFDPASERYPLLDDRGNLRCTNYPEALQPVERFVDGLRRVKADEPDSFLFAAITGVPEDLVTDPDAIDYDAILDDPRMQQRVDPDRGRLMPACDVVGSGFALPARRIVSVARAFGAQSVVQSICDDRFDTALIGITSRLARVIRRRRCR